MTGSPQAGLAGAIKSAFDRAVAALVLTASLPALAAVALVIAARRDGPVFFSQVRPGFRARPFRIYKFRTMSLERGPDGALLPDAQRLTRLGRFLRRTSLDELPQLWNVLRGELSLVGPRPLLVEYLAHYSPEQARRHEVLPGITGLAQVSGRNALAWSERFALDVWYVEHWSLALDLKILARTALSVFTGRGVLSPGEAGTERFEGAPTLHLND